ncbi:MAG TPA: OmpH family outer membrane protein [Bryobacteraceae bacterium]|nr:OmpH family outer membrane protein [Bryobacteraceae bacterium]
MKKNLVVFISLAMGVARVAAAQSAPPQVKVGVINIQSAMVSTKDGQKAVAELNGRMAPKQKELEKKQTDIRDLQDKLQKGSNTLAESAKDNLKRDIDAKTKNFNRDMEDAQAEMDLEQRKILDDLSQKMMQVIDKYAVANGYAVILDVSNPNTPVLYASNAVEVTKDIVDLYDKMQPTTAPSTPATKPTPSATKPAPQTTPPAAKPTAPPVTKKQP